MTVVPTRTNSPAPFAIQDDAFIAEYENHKINCIDEVDVEVHSTDNGKLFFLVGGEMGIPFRGSDFVMWCYGAEHTWMVDEATYEGYVITSHELNPLLFRVDKEDGYLYVSGEGTVTMPNGNIISLPRYNQP
jgi:hypothetical protein